jgi:hypothetical protein
MQHNKKRSVLILVENHLGYESCERGFASSTKMDFMNLRNEPTLKLILVEISTAKIYQTYVSGGVWSIQYQALM